MNFTGFELARHAILIEIHSYVRTTDYATFLEVGEEIRDAFTEAKKGGVDIHAAFKPAAGGKYHADLAMLATGILGSCGVTGISGCGLCTACEPDRLFSHRRSAPCGRMVSGIAIQPES